MIAKKCRYCEKIIEGYSEKQTNYLMNQHLLSKHGDMIIFNEPKNNDNEIIVGGCLTTK